MRAYIHVATLSPGEHEIKLAQEELAERTIKEVNRRTQDNNNYSFTSNAVSFAKKNPNLYIGKKVTFDDGQGYKLSTRVIKLITKLDYPIVQEITVGNQAVKGTISQLKENVDNILSGNYEYVGLNSTQASDLIKNFSETNLLSKVRPDKASGLIEFEQGVKVDGQVLDKVVTKAEDILDSDDALMTAAKMLAAFLRKDADDVARGLITFLGGLKTDKLTSLNYRQGEFGGQGFGVTTDEDGMSRLEVDNAIFRRKAVFNELEKRMLTYVGGNFFLSAAGSKIAAVAGVDADGKILTPFALWRNGGYYLSFDGVFLSVGSSEVNTDPSASLCAYRCFILSDDGSTRTRNWWKAGDQAQCRSFNIQAGVHRNVHNRYYWRLVVGVSRQAVLRADGKYYDYIDLAARETVTYTLDGVTYTERGYDSGIFTDGNGNVADEGDVWNDIPAEGDTVVQVGNRHDKERQNVIVLETTGVNAPSVIEYAGVDGFGLDGKRKTILSPLGDELVAKSLKIIINNEYKDLSEYIVGYEASARDALDTAFKKADGRITALDAKFSPYSATLNVLEGRVNRADGRISSAEADINNANKRITTLNNRVTLQNATITAHNGRINALASQFDTDAHGNIVKLRNTAGLLVTPSSAGLVAMDADGRQAVIGAVVEKDGKTVIVLGADNINLSGYVLGDNFEITPDGRLVVKHATVEGTIHATSGVFDGYIRTSTESFAGSGETLRIKDKLNYFITAKTGGSDQFSPCNVILPNDPEYIGSRIILTSAPSMVDNTGQQFSSSQNIRLRISSGVGFCRHCYAVKVGGVWGLANTVSDVFGHASYFYGASVTENGTTYLPHILELMNGYIELLGVRSATLHDYVRIRDERLAALGFAVNADGTVTGDVTKDIKRSNLNLYDYNHCLTPCQWMIIGVHASEFNVMK